MSGDRQDRKEDLAMDGLATVERRYRELADEKPPKLVDQAVLNRARAAVSGSRRSWPWTRSWAHNLATAVVVVLAATVLFQLRDAGDAPHPPPSEPAAMRADEAARLRETAAPAPSPRAMAAPPTARNTDAKAVRQRAVPAREEAAPAAAAESRVERRSPEAWVELILELRERGEREAADRELAAFREAWPEYPLPPELLD